MSATVDVTITTEVLPITEQVFQPLTLALLIAVVALVVISVFLYTRYSKMKHAAEKTVEELL